MKTIEVNHDDDARNDSPEQAKVRAIVRRVKRIADKMRSKGYSAEAIRAHKVRLLKANGIEVKR